MTEVVDVYGIKKRYKKAKKKFQNWTSVTVTHQGTTRLIQIKPANLKLAVTWLAEKEKKLISINGYDAAASLRYAKTLHKEISFLKNTLYWFNAYDLPKVTVKQIEKVYECMAKGKLETIHGKTIAQSTQRDYTNKVWKNGFFKFVGIAENAKEAIIRKYSEPEDVRFFELADFHKIVGSAKLTSHKLAFMLLFDTGVEVSAICQLIKKDFTIEQDTKTGDYYVLHVRKETGKKGRQRRDLPIFFQETNKLLKSYLLQLQPQDRLFEFTPANLNKYLKLITRPRGIVVKPSGSDVKLKDFRSSMATHLLTIGWSTDEVKSRLGHKPSSAVIDRYASYLGLNLDKKRREAVTLDMENYRQLYDESIENQRQLELKLKSTQADMKAFQEKVMANQKRDMALITKIAKQAQEQSKLNQKLMQALQKKVKK